MTVAEAKQIINANWPPENYAGLREALTLLIDIADSLAAVSMRRILRDRIDVEKEARIKELEEMLTKAMEWLSIFCTENNCLDCIMEPSSLTGCEYFRLKEILAKSKGEEE